MYYYIQFSYAIYIIKGTNIKNGKGIEYKINKDNILFIGEYLNGEKWNGNGKEYNKDGKLLFEGEYLDRERWNGNGKEYNENGELIFEGEYLNGMRNGKGKEYDRFGKILLEHGKGKEYSDRSGKMTFEGEYLNGKKLEKEKNMIFVVI